MSLATRTQDRSWADSLLCVLQQKSVEVIEAVVDALAPLQDVGDIQMALKCMSYTLYAEYGVLTHTYVTVLCVETDALLISSQN